MIEEEILEAVVKIIKTKDIVKLNQLNYLLNGSTEELLDSLPIFQVRNYAIKEFNLKTSDFEDELDPEIREMLEDTSDFNE